MLKHFAEYFWKFGKPYGNKAVDPTVSRFSYKIISDPYHKRLSIEKYHYSIFEKTIYDSCLLDFRHLTLKDQNAWHREILKEEKNLVICLLRDENDRAILVETLTFENNLCRQCTTSSIHGNSLATHRMSYRHLQDTFDGVTLYDIEDRPIMIKTYEFDASTGEFTHLLKEDWNIQSDFMIAKEK